MLCLDKRRNNQMSFSTYFPESREDWLKARLKDVTASESASLFGCGYKTEYELWHEKKKGEIVQFDSERMKWGQRIERVAAEGICEDLGVRLIDPKGAYYSNSEWRMGATPDFFVEHPVDGIGCLQIKCVDSLVFRREWSKPMDENIVPDHIEIQVQQEMLLTQMPWAYIGVLVGGNQSVVYKRPHYPQVTDNIRQKVAMFWRSIENDTPPPPDFLKDAQFIASLLSESTSGKALDLSESPRFAELAYMYDKASTDEKMAKDVKESCKAEMLTMISDAEIVLGAGVKVSAKEVKCSEGTLITPEMVGTHIGARKGYRGFRVTVEKEKSND
jgi:predicted phage-related endonuclease